MKSNGIPDDLCAGGAGTFNAAAIVLACIMWAGITMLLACLGGDLMPGKTDILKAITIAELREEIAKLMRDDPLVDACCEASSTPIADGYQVTDVLALIIVQQAKQLRLAIENALAISRQTVQPIVVQRGGAHALTTLHLRCAKCLQLLRSDGTCAECEAL